MKFLAFFLIPVVMGLSFIPCCSPLVKGMVPEVAINPEDCSDKGCCKETGSQTSDDTPENTCSSCSPFFSCGTCCGFTFDNSYTSFSQIELPTSASFPLLNIRFDSEYFVSKWQPPKIS